VPEAAISHCVKGHIPEQNHLLLIRPPQHINSLSLLHKFYTPFCYPVARPKFGGLTRAGHHTRNMEVTMNRYLKIAGVIAIVAAIALVAVAVASAQTPTPPEGAGPWPMGGFGGHRHGPGAHGRGAGFMAVDQKAMHAKIAEALGITVDEFEAALAEGKTPYILAQELGVDFAEVQAAMQAAHAEALAQAVADGRITQEQADWMLSHQTQMGGRHANGAGPIGPMGRGAHTGGFGGHAGECPYATP